MTSRAAARAEPRPTAVNLSYPRLYRESRFDLFNARDSHGSDALSFADKAKTFVGCGLDSDSPRRDLQGL